MVYPARVSTHHLQLAHALRAAGREPVERMPGLLATTMADDFRNQFHASPCHLGYDSQMPSETDALLGRMLGEFRFNEYDSTDRVFASLVNETIRSYIETGTCVYELYGVEEGSRIEPRIELVPNWSIRNRLGQTQQIALNKNLVTWVRLPRARLTEFDAPGRIGRLIRNTAEDLQAIDRYRAGDFDLMRNEPNYMFSDHKASLDNLAAKATASIGWDGREIFLDKATNSLRLHRKLRFRLTWIKLVDGVVKHLNQLASRMELLGDRTFSVRLIGLQAETEINTALRAIESGSSNLDEIFNDVYMRK